MHKPDHKHSRRPHMRARAEFREMPGMCLTTAQAARLWQLSPARAEELLERTRSGRLPGPPRRPALPSAVVRLRPPRFERGAADAAPRFPFLVRYLPPAAALTRRPFRSPRSPNAPSPLAGVRLRRRPSARSSSSSSMSSSDSPAVAASLMPDSAIADSFSSAAFSSASDLAEDARRRRSSSSASAHAIAVP